MIWKEEDLQRVLDYLSQKAEVFKEVRRNFNIGENLGLASLPEFNDYREGILKKIKLREFAKLPESRMVVKPLGGKCVYLVSVYFAPGIVENKKGVTLDESCFQASDEVITGLFAHECAEYLLHHDRKSIRPELLCVLEKEIYLERFPRKFPGIRFSLLNQCPADLLASMFGYKKEMLVLLRFLKDKHLKFENFPRGASKAFSYRPPIEIALEFKLRIDFIELTIKEEIK